LRGSVKVQVSFLLRLIEEIGNSKKKAKESARIDGAKTWHDIGKRIGIYSYATRNTYKDVWMQFLNFCREEYGVKDPVKLDAIHFKAYLEKKIADGIKYSTFQKHAAALEKLQVAINVFLSTYRPDIKKSMDYSKDIAEVRKKAQKLLKRFEGVRHYQDPQKVLNFLDGNYRLVAELQLRGGLRFSEAQKLKPFSFKGNGVIEIKGKGGKIRTVKIPLGLYEIVKKRVDDGIWYIKKETYLNHLKNACKLANEEYMGSHGLRWNYALNSFFEKTSLGVGYFEALQSVSHEMGHNRPDITEHYLFGVKKKRS